jgi:hypothetical protein
MEGFINGSFMDNIYSIDGGLIGKNSAFTAKNIINCVKEIIKEEEEDDNNEDGSFHNNLLLWSFFSNKLEFELLRDENIGRIRGLHSNFISFFIKLRFIKNIRNIVKNIRKEYRTEYDKPIDFANNNNINLKLTKLPIIFTAEQAKKQRRILTKTIQKFKLLIKIIKNVLNSKILSSISKGIQKVIKTTVTIAKHAVKLIIKSLLKAKELTTKVIDKLTFGRNSRNINNNDNNITTSSTSSPDKQPKSPDKATTIPNIPPNKTIIPPLSPKGKTPPLSPYNNPSLADNGKKPDASNNLTNPNNSNNSNNSNIPINQNKNGGITSTKGKRRKTDVLPKGKGSLSFGGKNAENIKSDNKTGSKNEENIKILSFANNSSKGVRRSRVNYFRGIEKVTNIQEEQVKKLETTELNFSFSTEKRQKEINNDNLPDLASVEQELDNATLNQELDKTTATSTSKTTNKRTNDGRLKQSNKNMDGLNDNLPKQPNKKTSGLSNNPSSQPSIYK